MTVYNKVTKETLRELGDILGTEHIIIGETISNEYTYDAGTKDGKGWLPEAVVFPGNKDEVAQILRLANRQLIPVTPRGGGSGLAGGAVPIHGGLVIDLRRMNRIIHIDPQAKYMVVEPGAPTLLIQQEAKKHGLLYVGDPCSSDDCVIAGNVATNAGGNRAVKYGVTGDQVYELEIVTPQGEIVNLGGRLKKNSTGYSLVKLLIGSEGTLGIITQITLKLHRLAPLLPSYFAVFPDLKTAITLVGILLEDSLDPISLELMDKQTVIAIESYLNKSLFTAGQGDSLIIQLEAQDQVELTRKTERLMEFCKNHGCISVEKAEDDTIWEGRRKWGTANKVFDPIGVSDDIVVPVDQFGAFIEKLQALTTEFGFEFRIAGHVGDGNIHVHTLPGVTPLTEWEERLLKFRHILYKIVYELGGRLSGEHGIGFKRKYFLNDIIPPAELELMKTVKKAFDPNLILNPGKIFDVERDVII